MDKGKGSAAEAISLYGPAWFAATAGALVLWPGLIRNLLASRDFMPHGHCYLWVPALVWLHVVSDLLIGLSYTAISSTLAYLVYKAQGRIPFDWIFLAFGLFIIACGATHFMEVWTVWHPHYWAAGGIKIATAGASVATAVTLPALVPRILALIEGARLSEQRRAGLERANAQLLVANSDLESFSYSVAHDLRAPLRAIDGFSRLIAEDYGKALGAEGGELLERVSANSQRMSRLIDDLLSFSRLGRRELSASDFELGDVFRDVFSELRAGAPDRTLRLTLHPLPRVNGDKALLRQVAVNLLSNAVKFTARKPEAVIEVGTRSQNGEIVVFVRDNGAGFDMRHAARLFGVFHRLHREDEFSGTGVGLAIAQRIIQRHGGRIWAESSVGEGATFYFTLPSPKGGG